MTYSSQAGLASYRKDMVAMNAGAMPSMPPWAPVPNKTIILGSAAFELRLSNDGHWYVIHAQGPSANAQALVGQGFQPGRNPYEWDQGYAIRIQQELNKG